MTDALVKDCQSMLACVLRMHTHDNGAIVFWNASRDFRMLLRNDPEEPGTVAFELCIVHDNDDDDDPDVLTEALQLEHDGYMDEDGMFVVDTFSYAMDELVRSPDLLEDARACVNRVHAYSLCKCGKYFVKDGAASCLFCQLTEDPVAPDAGARHFCTICHDTGGSRHMVKQACCGQMLHRACLATWRSTSRDTRCPLCRSASSGNQRTRAMP